jgi:hypothetical protein
MFFCALPCSLAPNTWQVLPPDAQPRCSSAPAALCCQRRAVFALRLVC